MFIFNFIFTDVFYATRRTKLDLTCICFEDFLTQLKLYIYINLICYQILQHNLLLR
jgi:hypothetical protein